MFEQRVNTRLVHRMPAHPKVIVPAIGTTVAISLALLLTSYAHAAANPSSQNQFAPSLYAYIALQTTPGQVITIDMSTINDGTDDNEVIGTLNLSGNGPEGIALAPDSSFFATANSDTGDLSIVTLGAGDPPALTEGILTSPGGAPDDAGISPDGNLVAAGLQSTNNVAFHNRALATTVLLATGTTGGSAQEVAFTPDGATAFVTNWSGSQIGVFDTSDQANITRVGTLQFGNRQVTDALVTSDGATLFAAAEQEEAILPFDLQGFNNVNVANIVALPEFDFVPQTINGIPFGESNDGPESVALSIDEDTLFVVVQDVEPGGTPENSAVVALDIRSYTDGNNDDGTMVPITAFDLEGAATRSGSKELCADPGGGILFVMNEDSDTISVFDISSFTDGNNTDGTFTLIDTIEDQGISEPNECIFLPVAAQQQPRRRNPPSPPPPPPPGPTPTPAALLLPALGPTAFEDEDLITKTVDKSVASVGDALTHTVTFANPKDITLTEVVVEDECDSRLDDVQIISVSKGTAAYVGRTVRVDGFELEPGQEVILVFSAVISDRARPGDEIPNQATLESPDASTHYSNTVTTLILQEELPALGAEPVKNRLDLLPCALILGGASTLLAQVLGRKPHEGERH